MARDECAPSRTARVGAAPRPPREPSPGGAHSLDDSLDTLLRFRGDAGARLESAYAASLTRTQRAPRSACLLFLGLAYAVAFAAYTQTAARLVSAYWGYLAVSAAAFALVPGVRAGSVLLANLSADVAAATILFAFNFAGDPSSACATGRYGDLMMFVAMPLLTGVMFHVPWRPYAVMCAAHAARAVVQLSPLGGMPPLLVCLTSALGAVFLYLEERRSREHFLALRALERAADRFEHSFRHICHEIRNPLHGVSAGVEACLSGELPPEEMRTELGAVADGVRMMTALMNDLLDLQKMRTGKFSVNIAVASPRGIVEACVRAVQPAVSVPIEAHMDRSVPEWILTDELRARQIIMNGLTNAIKYSNAPENGPIQVLVRACNEDAAGSAAHTPQAMTSVEVAAAGSATEPPPSPPPRFLCFEVLDRGLGLCGIDESVLFTDFAAPMLPSTVASSSHGTLTRRPSELHVGSSGVGLPICWRLAKLLDGELRVADRTDGVRGARFGLRLPLRLPPPVMATFSAGTLADVSSPAHDAQMRLEGRGTILVKRNVLIVDDSEGNRRLLRRMLQQLGCRVVEAADGDEVLAALAAAAAASADRHGVDVVLMDIEMARVGGIAAVREMRRAGWRTPAVAVTGHAGPDAAKEYISHGFNAVLAKPFLRDTLRDVILAECLPRTTPQLRPRAAVQGN